MSVRYSVIGNGASGDAGDYAVPNEDFMHLRDIVKKLRIKRAAAICSAGEIGLFTILPSVRESLTLIDYSPRQLKLAMTKYLLIQELGLAEAKRRFYEDAGVEGNSKLKCTEEILPDVKGISMYYGAVGRFWREKMSRMPERTMRRAVSKFDKVDFVHGNITDLPKLGTFDFVYLSNALEYTDTKKFGDILREIISPGGYILGCGGMRCVADQSELLHNERTSGGSLPWTYQLYRLKTEEQCEKERKELESSAMALTSSRVKARNLREKQYALPSYITASANWSNQKIVNPPITPSPFQGTRP